MHNINLRYNTEPVCPYCGKVQSDAWELHLKSDGDKTEVDCLACELPFTVELDLMVRYNTYSLREKVLAICEREKIAVPVSLTET